MGYCQDHFDKFVMKKNPLPVHVRGTSTAMLPSASQNLEAATPPFEVKREVEVKSAPKLEIKSIPKLKDAAIAKALATPKILLPRTRKKVVKAKRKTA